MSALSIDDRDQAFFNGLTAEKCEQTLHRKTRKPVYTWKLKAPGARNEPLDCAVLAYAALCGLRAMGYDLEQAVEELGRRVVYREPKDAPEQAPTAPARPTQRVYRERKSGWIDAGRDWLRR